MQFQVMKLALHSRVHFCQVKILHLGSAKECKSFFGTFILHPMLYVLVPSCHEDTNPTEHMMARCLLRAIPQN